MTTTAVARLEALFALPADAPARCWRPSVLTLEPGERPAFEAACRRLHLRVVDTLDRQLRELAAVRLPAGPPEARAALVEELIAAAGHAGGAAGAGEAGEAAAVGRWVVLPWERTVAHLLDADAWFEVITDRNRDKITREEQRLLRTKTIGVMGLSLGAEAAVTVAQEHLCGRIVLADFDRLDLSNMNRLGAGFTDIGERKTVLAARRIAKLNPYLDVEVYDDGVTEANMDRFLDGLDLLIEECDGLAVKYVVRERARARGLDIVFAGDERGFLSVEPYRRHPELPPFHGRVSGAQPPREAYPDARSFLRALAEWLGGWDLLSDRSRATLERIGATHGGYPQLASEARLAAGQVGHVVRRLLLGEDVAPFLGHLDLDAMVPSAPERS